MQFQRRFTIRTLPANDHTIVRFVFGRDESDLDELPGRHWRAGSGWLRL